MALIHLHNEIISYRELATESWSTYLSFSADDSTGAILAETFSVYHDTKRPQNSWKRRIGEQRISYNKAPLSVRRDLELLEDIIPAQPRDTISAEQLRLTANPPNPTAQVPEPQLA